MANTLESGHSVENISGEGIDLVQKNINVFHDGCIRLQPGGWFFPSAFARHANRIYNFKVKPTDVFVVTILKSGTNWIQEIVWNLVHNPDLDNPDADIGLDVRCPFYELDYALDIPGMMQIDPDGDQMKKFKELCPGKDPKEGFFINLAAFAPEPRLIKNHLPCCLLPPDMFKISKVIYLARDPRDVMVSYYHFSIYHKFSEFKGTLEDTVNDYINDRVNYGPYWEHVRLAWEKRNDPNFLFLFYEDLKADAKTEIKKVDKFLGTDRTDKQIDNIVQFTSFSNMKERTKDNPPTSFDRTYFNKDLEKEHGSFFRKGKVGSWRDDFTPELEEKVNNWMRENLKKFSDDFKYKIEFKSSFKEEI